MAACSGNILVGPQLHPGAAAWQRAGHQDETECSMLLTFKWRGQELCKSAGCQGAMRVPGQRAGWLSRHWGVPVVAEQGESFVSRPYKWDTLPWVMRLKWFSPNRGGCYLAVAPELMGACAGSAWGQDDLSHPGLLWYCLISSAKILTLRWDSPLGPEQGATPCQCREMYPSTLCLLSGYQSTGMPAQHLSKVLNNFIFFPLMSDFLLTRDCETR